MKTAGKIFLGGAGVMVLLLIVANMGGSEDKNQNTNVAPVNTQPQVNTAPTVVLKVTATDLQTEFKSNAIAAEAKYKGQTTEVTGVIKSIDKDILDKPYVTLDAGSFETVQCYFPKERESNLLDLKIGQTVTFRGNVENSMLGAMLRNCDLAS